MKILFITSTRIGDAVLSSGVLAHLIERHPDARITIACGPEAAPLFEAVPNVEHLIRLRKKRRGGHWLRLWAMCVVESWDLVVDLRRTAISWLVLTKSRRLPPRKQPGVHKARQLANALNLDATPMPRVWTSPDHRQNAARLIPDGSPVLAIAPTANWAGKVWAAERFAALIETLTKTDGILPGARVAVFSAPSERQDALAVLETVPVERRIDIAGQVDLLTAYACLARCSFFVGNDSALMHLAAAGGVPTLGLFGPSKPEHYAPWGPHTAYVRTRKSFDEIVNAPDYDYRNTGSVMESLPVEDVEEAAKKLWDARDEIGRVVQPRLSALVVAHNEEAQLAECLESLAFADERVVVLDKCTDGSKAIAEQMADRIVEGAWEIEGPRRHIGIDACAGDWILEVDADERVSDELAAEIRAALPGAASGYFLIPYDNYIGDRLVKYGWGGAWGVSSTARLFSRGAKHWGDQRIHPKVTFTGERRRLIHPMIHYVDKDVGDMIRRLDRYTAARAKDLRDNGINESLARNLRRVFTRFFKCYIRRKGYREGGYGVLIATMAAIYPLLSYLRAHLEEGEGT